MKILVAMSGGVDSTVSAYKLKNAGHEIIGCYVKLHGKENSHEENIKKVAKVANFLQIPYHVLDLQEDFKNKVYMPFVHTYKEGKTPNPCALCNRFIKFGKLLDFARDLNCEKLATGHYARLKNNLICTALDESKDQSYFLANVHKDTLQYLMFPLGEMRKEEVKNFASGIEILKSFATQKESSEICFVENTYIQVLDQFMNTKIPGEVLNSHGKVVGKHEGYMHYTIGKRRGFEVRGAHEPHFVLKINAQKNQIVVGTKEELKISEFNLKNINLFIEQRQLNCEVKIRYRSKSTPCQVLINDDRSAKITLKDPVYGLASGQMAVFYDNDSVIASGFIE